MVLFAGLALVGLMERVARSSSPLTSPLIMLLLALVIERVILRYMVNQEQIILFMATIGLTFFLEGFGETLWGSNVKVLDIGIPDAPLNVARIEIATPVLIAVFAVATALSIAILMLWRARTARRSMHELGGRSAVLPGPSAWRRAVALAFCSTFAAAIMALITAWRSKPDLPGSPRQPRASRYSWHRRSLPPLGLVRASLAMPANWRRPCNGCFIDCLLRRSSAPW